MSVLENFKNIPRSLYGGRQGSNVIFFSNFQRSLWSKKRGGLSPPPSGDRWAQPTGAASPPSRATGVSPSI